jgi:predicted RNA binding protein YcfA (HicA-like mRNA interferase family)
MSKHDKLLEKILRGTSDATIAFDALCALLHHLGFQERVRGSHHIFSKHNIAEIINLQPRGNIAKPYQVKQVREIVLKYKLGGPDNAKV